MFLKREKNFLQSLHTEINVRDWFPSEILAVLEEKNRLRQITSKVNISLIDIIQTDVQVAIRPPKGTGEDMVQTCELTIPHTDFKISNKIKEIVNMIDDPYRIYFSLSFICLYGNKTSKILAHNVSI